MVEAECSGMVCGTISKKKESIMDKDEKRKIRKLRKKAIKLQNTSSSKLSMAEALRRVKFESDSV